MKSIFNPIMSDPQLGISKVNQLEIAKSAHERSKKKPIYILFVLGFLLGGFSIVAAFVYAGMTNPNSVKVPVMVLLICFPINVVIQTFIFYRFLHLPSVKQELYHRGYDICLSCGYVLANVPDEQHYCPKCGIQRTQNTSE
jgi:predicted RNA-binding Zn-ribbon protein involved in translation (DUF1610 family)